MLDMRASSIFVRRFTHANRIPLEQYRGGNGRGLGPLEKPIAERTVSLKRDLTSLDNRLVRRCLVASDQERKPTQNICLILEAGHDFGWRRMIAGIDWGGARVKPRHNSSLSLTPFKASTGWV
ncbi:MAG: hypothetical protein WB781_23990 [Candidatus Sulfotelmatobacter sp.]